MGNNATKEAYTRAIYRFLDHVIAPAAAWGPVVLPVLISQPSQNAEAMLGQRLSTLAQHWGSVVCLAGITQLRRVDLEPGVVQNRRLGLDTRRCCGRNDWISYVDQTSR